jgi:hypothetical protein
MYRAAAVTLLLVVAASARAQVIYAPVQYQHSNGMSYYYGGNDPSMLSYIEHVKCRNGYGNAITGHGGNSLRHTLGQIGEQTYVFSDCLKYRNAAVYGYTVADARNEAMANMPLYFTKRDLLDAAVPAGDGTLVVPASGRSHQAMMHHESTGAGATTQPSEPKPRAIIIIPKTSPKHAPDKDEVKKVVAWAK